MNNEELKRLDQETLENLKEGTHADECICNLFPLLHEGKRGFGPSVTNAVIASLRKAGKVATRTFASMGGTKAKFSRWKGQDDKTRRGLSFKKRNRTVPARQTYAGGQTTVNIPLVFSKDGKGIVTTREVIKHKNSCGRCGCDDHDVALNHALAKLTIVTPDISSICRCPGSKCFPDKDKFNNVNITIERMQTESKISTKTFTIADKDCTIVENTANDVVSTKISTNTFVIPPENSKLRSRHDSNATFIIPNKNSREKFQSIEEESIVDLRSLFLSASLDKDPVNELITSQYENSNAFLVLGKSYENANSSSND